MTTLWLPSINMPFVQASDSISATEGRWAIIGGFAVWIHLGGAHRVTLDIDAAAGPVAHQTLVTVGVPGTNASQRILSGAELEIIEVHDPIGGLDGLDAKQRLFIAAHWAAAAHPIQATIRCDDIAVVAPVASWLALVGCKLHAWLDRHSSQDTKRGSDGVDIIQLLRRQPEPSPLVSPVEGLADSVRWAAEQVLIDQATLVRRLILIHADRDIEVDEIELLGQELVERLT
jgi:hypothetical protein